MAELPIRVAVVSPSRVVRAGLVALIAELHGGAVVIDSGELGDHPGCPRDVVLYDVGALTENVARADLRGLDESRTPVVAVFYGEVQSSRMTDMTPAAVTLAVTSGELLLAIRRAMAGCARPAGPVQLPGGLTEREFSVITLVAGGMSNQEIASRLFLSPNSVKTYIRTAYRKMKVRNRPEAILWALEHGLAVSHHNAPG